MAHGTAVAAVVGIALAGGFLLIAAVRAETFDVIEVRGNAFLAAEDIQAACDIAVGDYAEEDLAAVTECLMSSGQFRSVELRPEGETLVVEVAELNDRPGRVELGLAYDSHDGAMGTLYFERYNLLPDVFGALDLTYAAEVRSLQSHLYWADAWGDLDLGLDFGLKETSYSDQGFTAKQALVEPYLAYPFAKGARFEWGFGYRWQGMADVDAAKSPLFTREAGRRDAPFMRIGFRYASSPAAGGEAGALNTYSIEFDQYFWDIGSDDRFQETRVAAEARFALGEATALHLGIRGGRLSAASGRSTRAVDRFFIGGADFRGFAPRGLGPKDAGAFVGANSYYVASVEIQRDLGKIFGTSARVGLFSDIGSAWALDDTLGGVIDDGRKQRSSIGLSLTLDLGTVPVSLYLAKPMQSQERDERQSFGISFNTAF